VAPAGLANNRQFFAERVNEREAPEPVRLALYDPQTSGGLLVAIRPKRAAAFRAALTRSRVWHVEAGVAIARTERAVELDRA
jgi:selenide,water dikinase